MSNPSEEETLPFNSKDRSRKILKPNKEERKAAKKLSKMMSVVATELGAQKSIEPTEASSTHY